MNRTWIRIGCACLGAMALAGCQQDRGAEDTDVTVTASNRMEAVGRVDVSDERMSRRAARVAHSQFSGAGTRDADAVVSSSGETFYGVDLDGSRQVIFNDDGVAVTGPIADVSGGDTVEVIIDRDATMDRGTRMD